MNRSVRVSLLLALVLTGCAARRTDVSIPEKPLPASFAGSSSGPSVAQTRWREWFSDERLNGLIAEALTTNQDLLIALERIQIARAGVQAATGAMLPQVGLSLGSSVRKFGLYTMDGAGNAATEITPGRLIPVHLADFGVALQSSWEVDIWGRLRNQRQSAIAQYLASVEGTNLVLTSLIADVAAVYFELLSLDHVREVLQQSVARQQEAVEVVRLQKMAGRANELAVQQFEAQLAETRASERQMLLQTAETENRLNVLLGRYPQPIARNKDTLFADVRPTLSAGVPSELLKNRPDIREAELQVLASKYDLKAARAAFFPSLNITANVGLQAFNPAFLLRIPESTAYSLVGGLFAPLVNRAALEAQFSGARANQIQAMYNYQRAIVIAFVEVANALSAIRHTEEILVLKKAQKDAMVQAAATADMLYRAGKASYLEVLMARQGSLRADLDLIEIWKRRRTADVVIYRALGGGWR